MVPNDLKYTEDHEWVRIDGDTATIGITHHAAEELGEIVFCDLSAEGEEIDQRGEFGSVESVKTVSSLFLPLTGIIDSINDDVTANPSNINDSPYEDGWLVKISIADPKEVEDLMTAGEYEEHLENA